MSDETDGIEEIEVKAIHRKMGVLLLSCGCFIPITNWLNKAGDECSADDAVVCVAGDDEHGWVFIELDSFESVTVH